MLPVIQQPVLKAGKVDNKKQEIMIQVVRLLQTEKQFVFCCFDVVGSVEIIGVNYL
jgi:hypothetical protein